uniref:Uncharacterized protein n=1 Tax=Oryza rufipogon TaxID=4529 RepID=A0A0E0QU70_ORYRU
MAASRPARSFDLHNVLQLTGTATSSFPAGGGRLISLALWPIRTSIAGSESSSETAAPVRSSSSLQLWCPSNRWWPMAEYIDMHCSASTRTTHEFQ